MGARDSQLRDEKLLATAYAESSLKTVKVSNEFMNIFWENNYKVLVRN